MRGLVQIFAAFLAVLFQMTLAEGIAIAGIRPDFILLLVIYLVMRREGIKPIIIGFLIGFLQDLQNPSFLGLNALCNSLVAFAVAKVSRGMVDDHGLFQALLVFSAVLFHDIIYLPFFFHLDFGVMALEFFRSSIPTAIYTAVVGILVLYVSMFLVEGGNRIARRA